MGAASKQTTRTKKASSRPNGEKTPARTQARRSGSQGSKAPTQRKAPARSATGQRFHVDYVGTRLVGALLLVLGLGLLVQIAVTGSQKAAPLSALTHQFGYALVPISLLVAVFGASLSLRPSWFVSIPILKPISGLVLLGLVLLTVLGATGTGGTLGTSLWLTLYRSIGAGTPLVLFMLAISSLLLLGVSTAIMVSFTRIALTRLGKFLLAVALGAVGFAVWSARKLWGQPEMERQPVSSPQRLPRKPEPKALEQPAIEVEDIPELTDDEDTQEFTPVVHKFIEETVKKNAVPRTDWTLPSIEMLEMSEKVEVSEAEAIRRARTIENTLRSFSVDARVREINPGPTVTQFALEPGPGVKVSRITTLRDDLALALAAPSVRMEAPVPGRSRVGLEIPNEHPITVRLRDIMSSSAYHDSKALLKMALGRNVTGQSVVGDLSRMPHLLIAGATGAGKSSCLNSTIMSFLFQCTPEDLRFLMIDPKMVELKTFDGIPHLIWPVVTDVNKVVGLLKYAVIEMERRYNELSKLNIRNLEGYNAKIAAQGGEKLPRIVIVIDELADLMMVSPDEVEDLICRLAQKARAVGIHLIIATQRPSVDVLTGLIKANFPSRIAFAVSSQVDSKVILDMPGAERLLGRGDMLFVGPDSGKAMRVQGTFVSDEEIESVVEFWKELRPASYDEQIGKIIEGETAKSDNPEQDALYSQAMELAHTHGRLSTSLLQRKLRIGYNRAARLMDSLRDSGELDTELDD